MEINDNKNTTTQNLWDAAKAVLRGKCIAIQSLLKKEGKFQKKSNPTLKTTRERRTKKQKVSRKKEIIKIRSEKMKKK